MLRDIRSSFSNWKRLLASTSVVILGLAGGFFVTALEHSASDTDPAPGVPVEVTAVPSIETAVPVADALRLRTCHVEGPELSADTVLHASVLLASTGEELWSEGARTAVTPASVMKVLTARAALAVLGEDYRFRTRVLFDPVGNRLVVVGGGDTTLTRLPIGSSSYYPGAAHVDTLLDQSVVFLESRGLKGSPLTLLVDQSRYASFPAWDDSWRPGSEQLGFIAPISSFHLDGGRDDPSERISPRSSDPSLRALGLVESGLLARGVELVSSEMTGEAVSEDGLILVSVVSSSPVSDLVGQMLRDSDNQLAEMLIRETAVAAGVNSFEEAIRLGLPEDLRQTTELFVQDGSGLSPLNQVSPHLVALLLRDVVADPQWAALRDGLPRPGGSGSLARRFTGVAGDAAPFVRAKTGTLTGVRSLAGIVGEGEDTLVFSVMVSGTGVDDSERGAIDGLVTEWFRCGENLSHWK